MNLTQQQKLVKGNSHLNEDHETSSNRNINDSFTRIEQDNQEKETEPKGVLFNSSYQMAKELNQIPHFGIDQSLHLENNPIQQDDLTVREKKITWFEVSKNILENPNRSASTQSQKQQNNSGYPNRKSLKNTHQSNQNCGNKYFTNVSKINQTVTHSTSNYRQQQNHKVEDQDYLQSGKLNKIIQRSNSLDKNFVYFDNNLEINNNMKKQFWQQMRQIQEVFENEEDLTRGNQSVEQQAKRNQQIKRSFLYQRKQQGKAHNSNSTVYSKSSVKTKEVKNIERIKVRRKSCCCKECGQESNKMKKLISIPSKTVMQHLAESSKLGLNTGLKCVAFIGKVRKSRLFESPILFQQQVANNQNSQDSFSVEIDEQQNTQESQTTLNDQTKSEKLNLNLLNDKIFNDKLINNPEKKSFTELIQSNQNNSKSQILDKGIKPREEQIQIVFNQRKSILEPIIDQKNECDKNEEETNSIQRKSFNSHQYQKQVSDWSDNTDQNEDDYVDEHDKDKINTQTQKKKIYKPLDKSKNTKKIIDMMKQQSRVGHIQKMVINKDTINPEIQSCKTPKRIEILTDWQSLTAIRQNNNLNQQSIYHKTQRINSVETPKILNRKNIIHENDFLHQNQNSSIESIRDNQKEKKFEYSDSNKLKLQPLNTSIINSNRMKQQLGKELNNKVDYDQQNFSMQQCNNNNAEFLLSEKKKEQNINFFDNSDEQLKNNNQQLQQMIYLPLKSLSTQTLIQEVQSPISCRNKQQQIVQQNRKLILSGERYHSKSFQTQIMNQSSETSQEAMLISFNRRIDQQEEEKLVQLSKRGDIKLQKQYQGQLLDQTFTPKLTTEKDFFSRFQNNKKYLNQQLQNTRTQKTFSKMLNESTSFSQSLNKDKSPLIYSSDTKSGSKLFQYLKKQDESQIPTNKGISLTSREGYKGSYLKQLQLIQQSHTSRQLNNKYFQQNQGKIHLLHSENTNSQISILNSSQQSNKLK